ncbi:MAG: NfeD family protein [Actinomycetota bacterium]|nr:NfeD family protein [Actinomycetota bacterium]
MEVNLDPEIWQWIWLAATGMFVLGELAMPGSFFLLPFGAGTAVATILAFSNANESLQWIAFIVISLASLAALRPLARKLNSQEQPARVGSTRLIGEIGVVTKDLGEALTENGSIQIGREEWPAETLEKKHVPAGTRVKVIHIEGTRVVVEVI